MIFRVNTTKYKLLLLSILLGHLFLLYVTQFTLWPEIIVYPYLANSGFLNYRDIINPYPPIFTITLEYLYRFFGNNVFFYKILTWTIIVIIDLIIFKISLKITKKTIRSLFCVLFFVIFSIPFGVNGLWFDLVQTPLLLSSLFYLTKFLDKGDKQSLLVCGLFVSISFFVKQNTAVILLWFILLFFYKFRNKTSQLKRVLVLFLLPFFLMLGIFFLLYFIEGTIADYKYWVFIFPFLKASSMHGYLQFPTIRQVVVVLSLLIIFVPVVIFGRFMHRVIFTTAIIMLTFAYPRFDLFHLIPSLAVFSVIVGVALSSIKKINFWTKQIIIFSLILLLSNALNYFLKFTNGETRFFENEIYRTASFLRQNLTDEKYMYIQNGPDQLFPLTQNLPLKPWVDEFPWYLEIEGVQERIVEGLKLQNPRFIVYKPYSGEGKYGLGSYRPNEIASYIDENYENYTQISDELWLKIRK